jgi:hypothetical protein
MPYSTNGIFDSKLKKEILIGLSLVSDEMFFVPEEPDVG